MPAIPTRLERPQSGVFTVPILYHVHRQDRQALAFLREVAYLATKGTTNDPRLTRFALEILSSAQFRSNVFGLLEHLSGSRRKHRTKLE